MTGVGSEGSGNGARLNWLLNQNPFTHHMLELTTESHKRPSWSDRAKCWIWSDPLDLFWIWNSVSRSKNFSATPGNSNPMQSEGVSFKLILRFLLLVFCVCRRRFTRTARRVWLCLTFFHLQMFSANPAHDIKWIFIHSEKVHRFQTSLRSNGASSVCM